MSKRSKFWLEMCLVTLAFGVAYSCYTIACRREESKLAPPPGVRGFSDFSKAMPPPFSILISTVDGQEYLLWTGKVPAGWRLASGPPAYVFDKTGQLIDWTVDNGEAPTFYEKWYTNVQGENLPLEVAQKWFTSKK
jgi:hypothetical protein